MSILEKIRRHGPRHLAQKALTRLQRKSGFTAWRYRHAPMYVNPTRTELDAIEQSLLTLGITVHDYMPSPDAFKKFQDECWFPPNYHGGPQGLVWHEKLLEHWISSEILGLSTYRPDDIYIDIAAASSPWAHTLRERHGITSYAIDIQKVDEKYAHLGYYRIENATQTSFANASVKGASLHCAYEMFMNNDDIDLIHEAARFLQPGGKIVILPLYMHTHYCAYASPEYFGKGLSDPAAAEYIRLDSTGIPSSRKYDPARLKYRVLNTIESHGMSYKLYALRNKETLGDSIYCHFILEIER